MPLEHINLSRSSGAEASAGKSGDKFTATPEELRVIQEKMKDPVFAELMHEYMMSLEDPETRREEEAYLEQAEREAREGGDYSFEFVFPRAAYVVELLDPWNTTVSAAELKKLGLDTDTTKQNGSKLRGVRSFLNMCSSDKVKAFTEHTTGDVNGSNWEVPVSVSQRRIEAYNPVKSSSSASIPSEYAAARDSASAPSSSLSVCIVRDVVFHPSTLSLADRSTRFLCFLTEIAVEHINSGYGESNGFQFRRLPSSIASIGTPLNQTIRSASKTGGSPFDVDPRAPVLTKPTKNFKNGEDSGNSSPNSATRPPPPPAPAAAAAVTSSTPRVSSAKASTSSRARDAKGPKSTVSEAAEDSVASSKVAALPPYTITHRGTIDLADAWQWKVSDKRVGVPEELIVKMTFAGVRRAAMLDISITPEGHAVRVEPTAGQSRYEGLLVLPFTVEETPRQALFDCTHGVLTLTLKVVPPPLPDGVPSAEQLRKELQGEPCDAVGEEMSEISERVAGDKQAQLESPLDAASPPAAAVKAGASAKEVLVSTASVARAESPQKASAHPPAVTPAAKTSSGPELAHIGDQARVAAMMAQVRAAREAREAAAAAADAVEAEGNNGLEPAPRVESAAAACPSPESAQDTTSHQAQQMTSAFPGGDTPAGTAAAEGVAEEAIPFIRKSTATTTLPAVVDMGSRGCDEESDDLTALRARQQAWAAMIEADMKATKAREEAEAAKAAEKAEAQAAKARRKIEAEKEVERLAHIAKVKRDSLPLSNKYIFSID
ncbi:hypothetical protein JKF63_06608 [Porcisia hertigi]|uniref:Uncharacterized protein n=1 Tax=Porcisia hertigi TaxID=2761500 RepID=A0A836I958_9TRYP|nr:hypothetical protein JKF63_06608 [Porcisia hertigi]